MTRTFVAIDDPVHGLVRNITRTVPLGTVGEGKKGPVIAYQVKEEDLPEEYFTLVMLHSVGGMPLPWLTRGMWRAKAEDRRAIAEQVDFFDAVRLDRRCCRDVRLKPATSGAAMLSAELLAYGTGMLRACNDDSGDPLHQFISSQYGRITSRHEIIHARVKTLHRRAGGCPQPTVARETYESTNMIYGDVLGELEQLWDRRADTQFLDEVAHSLKDLRQNGEVTVALNAPFNIPEMVRLHLRAQSVWTRPPENARSLIRRLDFIFEHLTIDSRAAIQSFVGAADAGMESPHNTSHSWRPDDSGYDGWLAGMTSED